jgi:O-antigen ligase
MRSDGQAAREPGAAPPSLQTATGTVRRATAPRDRAELALFACAALLLFVSLIFGGASQGNALSLAAVEVTSLPLLFVAVFLMLADGAPRGSIAPIALLMLIVATPLVQLIPLPPNIWTSLPGRRPVIQVLDLVGLGRPSLPLSLAPEATWRAALALVPPTAMFLGALQLTPAQRRFMAGCWLALAAVSLGLGVLQVVGGPGNVFYFYEITNAGSPVGFFSNRNHLASLLLCLVPVAGVFAARFAGRIDDWRALPALLAVLYLFIAIVGVAATRSRAGIFLLGLALVGVFAILLRSGLLRRHWRAAIGVGLGVAVAIGAVLAVGLGPILERFAGGGELRFEGWPIVLKLANGFLPLGSGVGSFQTLYPAVEPLSQVSPIYFNHAHNDYLELWLETGVVGAALFAGFVVWFLARFVMAWSVAAGRDGDDLAAACTLLVLLLLGHSLLDYPLRTEAMAVLFAFACAIIAAPPEQARPLRAV